MSQTASVPPFLNKTMKLVLNSPFHGIVSKTILLITFTGRKSGKRYTTPVSYSQDGDQINIFTHASWWVNLKGGASVTLCIRGREIQGVAEPIVEDKEAITKGLLAHLKRVPSDARYYNVTFDDRKNPSAEEVKKAAETVVMIPIRLS